MSSPGVSPLDLSPAQRPTADHFNGAQKADDQSFAPDPVTMPNAAEANTTALLLVSLGAMMSIARISVGFSGGNPIVTSSQFPGVTTTVTPTIARTSGGAAGGDVTITWPAGSLPAPAVNPAASLNAGPTILQWNAPTAIAVANGVRVITSIGTTGTDLPFTVVIS